ncbi:Phosphate regulon sensor protein PhoR (SphS) [Minicystis rosea]|nr:Phosphate regulon sensor protein PhoR (SphS) [Minicystis rosea]
MSRLIVTAASAVALIFFVAFIVARLLRSRSRGFSIRMQFFLALASIVGAFALGLGLLVLDRLEARTTLIAEGAARDEAEAIAALVGSEMDARGAALDEIGRKYAEARGSSGAGGAERGLALLDQAGKEIFASGLGPKEPSTVFVSAPIVVSGTPVGSVRVVKRTIVIRRALEDMAPFILTVSIVLGVTAALAADFIGRRIARPIEALTDFAGRVSEGERRAVPPPPAHGREVLSLTVAIDSMRRQIEGRPFVETFAADLSHELKNPVAAIRASAEVLADGALDEPEEAMRFVARIQEATTRIEALLGDLLSLARIEARGLEGAAPLDLGDLARQAVERARERGAEVSFQIATEPGVTVRGDPLWLSRAVDNLLENGRIHGRPEGEVQVEVARRGEQVVLSVRNEGEIGRHVEKRLFRRFVTTRADRGGTGLGLAIVRAIAEAHSGSAVCATAGPPHVEFRISLPAA